MKIGIFYFSRNRGKGRYPVKSDTGQVVGYVRVEIASKDLDLDRALNEAEPAEDESVMNTHRILQR